MASLKNFRNTFFQMPYRQKIKLKEEKEGWALFHYSDVCLVEQLKKAMNIFGRN